MEEQVGQQNESFEAADFIPEASREVIADAWKKMRESAERGAQDFSAETQQIFQSKEQQYGINMINEEVDAIHELIQKTDALLAKLKDDGDGIVSGEIIVPDTPKAAKESKPDDEVVVDMTDEAELLEEDEEKKKKKAEEATDQYWKMVTGKIDRTTREPITKPEQPAERKSDPSDAITRIKDIPQVKKAKERAGIATPPQDIIDSAAEEALDQAATEEVNEVELFPEEMTYQELSETLPVQVDVLLEGDYDLKEIKDGQQLIDAMFEIGILTDEFHDELSADHIRRNVLFRNFVKERQKRGSGKARDTKKVT